MNYTEQKIAEQAQRIANALPLDNTSSEHADIYWACKGIAEQVLTEQKSEVIEEALLVICKAKIECEKHQNEETGEFEEGWGSAHGILTYVFGEVDRLSRENIRI